MLKTKWNWQRPAAEKNCKSQTVPDQSMSIREIMLKHSRGIPVTTKMPQYHDDTDLDNVKGIDVRKLDIVEVHQEMNEVAERLDQTRQEQERARKEKQMEDSAKAEQEQRMKWKQEYEQELRQKVSSEAAEGRRNALA